MEAGIQKMGIRFPVWIPVYAGMTVLGDFEIFARPLE